MSEPQEGQLRGIGLRPDPQGVLIAPHEVDGKQYGYTIIDKDRIPTMYIKGEWKDVVPEGVWYQMLANWEDISKFAEELFIGYPEYLQYPEIKKLAGK